MNRCLPVFSLALALVAGCSAQPPATDDAQAPSEAAAAPAESRVVPLVPIAPETAAPTAQMPPEMTGPLIQMAASMTVAGSLCEGGDISVSRERARANARAEMTAQGVAPAEFDRQFDAAYADSMQKAQAMTPAEREQVCVQVRQMAEQMKAAAAAAAQQGG